MPTEKQPKFRQETIEEFIARTTKASGVPYYVEDGPTLQRIARLLLQGDQS